MDDDAIYMGTRELAAFLGLSPRTLDRYRVSGGGPKFHKFGNRVRYARADVEAWAAERRYSSTSDEGGSAQWDGVMGGPACRGSRTSAGSLAPPVRRVTRGS